MADCPYDDSILNGNIAKDITNFFSYNSRNKIPSQVVNTR